MLVAVFGYDLLAERAITGRKSNRSKPPNEPLKSLDPKKVLAIRGNI